MAEEGFSRINFQFQDQPKKDAEAACKSFREALALREKYISQKPSAQPVAQNQQTQQTQQHQAKNEEYSISLENGVYKVSHKAGPNQQAVQFESPPPFQQFFDDFNRILAITGEGPVKSISYWRLKILERKYNLHCRVNRKAEKEANKDDVKDWTLVTKVDTHVHLAAAMTRKHLLSFISAKARDFANEIVVQQSDGKQESLSQVLARLNLSPERLTIEALDVAAGSSTFQRFDEFNSKYSPFGYSELRTIFMKTANYLNGRYMAELTHELFKMTNNSGYATEYRLSIYGSKRNEWTLLAKWINDFNVRCETNRWLIQIPRIYNTFVASGNVKSFQDMLDNIFIPLFEVTLDPAKDPGLHKMLAEVSGFDSVDDESKLERMDKSSLILPAAWNTAANPPYAYYAYFIYANICALNRLREAKGFNTFDFRPHCGESGDIDNLAAGFLLAKGINHGINLMKSTPLQYMYYLANIGIAVSPISNNALFLDYKRNPFYQFFQRGLNVSLSTDDPLQFHFTQSPLCEEYVVASKRWRLNECDLSEIARYSVLQSGFPHETKVKWLGKNYLLPGVAGNDIGYTNVPNMRIAYRWETWQDELAMLKAGGPIITSAPAPQQSITIAGPVSAKNVSAEAANTLPATSKLAPFNRASITDNKTAKASVETEQALKLLREALAIRSKYRSSFVPDPKAKKSHDVKHLVVKIVDGIANMYQNVTDQCHNDTENPATVVCAECKVSLCAVCDDILHKHPSKKFHSRHNLTEPLLNFPSLREFISDFRKLVPLTSNSGPLLTYCATRLDVIEHLFGFHTFLNETVEHKARMDIAIHDQGKVLKVDNHIHLTGSMSALHLLDFIKQKLKNHGNDIVKKAGNETLTHMFERLGINGQFLTIDSLGVKADDVFQRFDTLSSKYNLFGSAELHSLFLSRNNDVDGRYLAELVKEMFKKNEQLASHTEIGISVHGRDKTDWDRVGWWIHHFKVDSPSNKWVVQIPTAYEVYKREGKINNFQELLSNIFLPLFEASKNPANHPYVAKFLERVTAFDMVDDEGQLEMNLVSANPPLPNAWDSDQDPPYAYYSYYIFANMVILNEFRKSLGLNTFGFRPHCGAAGDTNHLSVGFMFANNIVHGLNLRRSPILQYLYYLAQIGITCSVVSEDSLYVAYENSPFPALFRRGLNVTLSSDSPLLLHSTGEPLSEEYAIAAQMWKLSECDMCEIGMNSMRQTGHFTATDLVAKYITNWAYSGHTGVPEVRLRLREELLREEWAPINEPQGK